VFLCLAPQPALILLDEPLSNLDVQSEIAGGSARDFRQRVRLNFVTHDQEEALSIADQVAVMRQGRLEQIGTPEEISLASRRGGVCHTGEFSYPHSVGADVENRGGLF